MTSPCSSSNSNFVIFEWNSTTRIWSPVCETCDDGFIPPLGGTLPDGTFNGEQRAESCIRMVVDPPPGD